MPKLIFTGEQFAGRVYELAVEKTTVGRGDHNTLVLRDNSVSQTHCEIIVNGPEVIIHDLNSANGTFVAGARLNSQSQVLSGQLVRFGAVEARLELEAPSTDPTDEVTAVYAMNRAMREQRKEKNHPKPPADISAKIEPLAGSDPATHTMVMTRKTPAQPAPPAPSLAPVATPPAPVGKTKTLLLVAAIILGLGVVCWVLWGKR